MTQQIKEANEKLIHILSTIKPVWGDPRVKEIQKAIKSAYIDNKLYIIKKYEK